jgi:hypothetical protein
MESMGLNYFKFTPLPVFTDKQALPLPKYIQTEWKV